MSLYSYLFTGLFRLLIKTSEEDIAEYSAAVFLAVGISLNLFILLNYYEVKSNLVSGKNIAFIVPSILILFNYLFFIRSNKYKTLADSANEWPKQRQQLIDVVAIVFCIESIILPIAYSVL